jgi:hypothetical protein
MKNAIVRESEVRAGKESASLTSFQKLKNPLFRGPWRGAGTAARFAKPQGVAPSIDRAGPQAFRLSLRKPFGPLRKADFPTGAFANRAPVPAPSPSCPTTVKGWKRKRGKAGLSAGEKTVKINLTLKIRCEFENYQFKRRFRWSFNFHPSRNC